MAKSDFVEKIDDGCYLVEGKWYPKCHYEHLIEETINNKKLLLEYYRQVSEPNDDILGEYQVWVYGADRGEFTPHCHIMKSRKGSELNVEIHLLDFEAFHMESPKIQNITWDDLPKEIHDRFMEWLISKPAKGPFQTNMERLFDDWDGNNPTNTLKLFIEKHKLQDKINPYVKEYLYGKPINLDELVSSFFTVVLPLYQKNKEEKERLHHIVDPIAFAKEVGLPFEFNEYNVTPKIKDIINNHEKMCYEMAKN